MRLVATAWLLLCLQRLAPAGCLRAQQPSAELPPGVPPSRSPFRDVLLVVHCRGKWKLTDEEALGICEQRRPLFRDYEEFFGQVMYVNRRDFLGGKGDPHGHLARIMQSEGEKWAGVMYTHFDALINPRTLAEVFDPLAIGTFDDPRSCSLDGEGSLRDCRWNNWKGNMKARFRTAARELGPAFLDPSTLHLGNDDLFYIPRAAYPSYTRYARVLSEYPLMHEIVGPHIRAMVVRDSNATMRRVSFNCTGGCCRVLRYRDLAAPGFRCGHVFDLREEDVREGFGRLLRGLSLSRG